MGLCRGRHDARVVDAEQRKILTLKAVLSVDVVVVDLFAANKLEPRQDVEQPMEIGVGRGRRENSDRPIALGGTRKSALAQNPMVVRTAVDHQRNVPYNFVIRAHNNTVAIDSRVSQAKSEKRRGIVSDSTFKYRVCVSVDRGGQGSFDRMPGCDRRVDTFGRVGTRHEFGYGHDPMRWLYRIPQLPSLSPDRDIQRTDYGSQKRLDSSHRTASADPRKRQAAVVTRHVRLDSGYRVDVNGDEGVSQGAQAESCRSRSACAF